jgi:eukaryotic-like serine/threonine-protein kinase
VTRSAGAPPPGPPRLPLGSVLQGRYRLLSVIGDGAMGSVYRAERIGLERQVAVKFIDSAIARDPSFVKRFEVELRAMGRLAHPHCISVIDYGVEALPYLVMELVEGQSLRSLLAGGRLPPRRALTIACQLLAGLAHAHAKGIVHRDVKPENVLLEAALGVSGDCVRIVDFGLAKLLDSASKLTLGTLLGSPHYMPPEQMSAGAEIDARVDIYTTGIVLYEMLTGARPFDGPTLGDVLLAQKQDPPPRFSKVAPGLQASPALERVVRRALEKAPGARFQSALEMIAAIEALPELAARDGAPQPRAAAAAAAPPPAPPPDALAPDPAHPPPARARRAADALARRAGAGLRVALGGGRAAARAVRSRWSSLPRHGRLAAAIVLAGLTTALFVAVALAAG